MTEPDPLRSAVDAAVDFFREIDAQRWDSAARRVDPDAAIQFRESALGFLVGWAAMRAQPGSPDGPVAVAPYGTLDADVLARLGSTPLRGIRGVSTLAELAGLTPVEFVAKSLEHHSGGTIRDTSTGAPAREVLAAVADGTLAAQVVYCATGANSTDDFSTSLERLGMRLRDGRWFVDLERNHRAIVSLLRNNMDGPPHDGSSGER